MGGGTELGAIDSRPENEVVDVYKGVFNEGEEENWDGGGS